MIRDMGREIVRQESLDPGKRSRLWYPDDVLEVLRSGTGTEAVKGLILNATDVQVNAKAFEKMNNLWLLHLDYVHLAASYEHISRRLLWLSWKGFPLDCIPCNFSMEKLLALDLSYSRLNKVWNGNMILGKLKFLYLSHCHYLTKTPDFSGLSSLEELLLNDCKSLVEVDESIRCLNNLLVLDMKNCTKLRKLPSGILMLKYLERLDLSGCSNLGNLGVFKGTLYKIWCSFFSSWTLPQKGMDSIGLSLTPVQASNCLTELYLKDCNLSCLSEKIGNLISLRTLNLAHNNLSTLPDGICNLTCLKCLRLEENNVSNLPSGIGRLTSLESLNLSRNNLCTLPDTIGKLSCLKDLLVGNNKLSHLPSEIGDLDSLLTLVLEGNNGFRALPESICKLRLSELYVAECNLSHLPSEFEELGILDLAHNILLRSLPKLPTLTMVFANSCPSLESPPLELDQLGSHADYSGSNKLAENNYLTSLLKQLPKSKGLSELEEAVDILVPAGEEELCIWFPYHDVRGPNVSFVVPPSPFVNQKMLGWILRFVVWAPRGTSFFGLSLSIDCVIRNKIRSSDLAFLCEVYTTDVDHVWLIYIPQGYRGLQLEGGDEVEIPIDVSPPNMLVKKWAIDLIYEADEIHKGNDTWCQVVSI